jgi:hypothetical protein
LALSGAELVSSVSDSATAAKVLGLPGSLGFTPLSAHLPLATLGFARDVKDYAALIGSDLAASVPLSTWRLAGAGPEKRY